MTKFSDILTDSFQDILHSVFQLGLCHVCGRAADCYPEPGTGLSYCLVCLEEAVVIVQRSHIAKQDQITNPTRERIKPMTTEQAAAADKQAAETSLEMPALPLSCPANSPEGYGGPAFPNHVQVEVRANANPSTSASARS